MASSEPGRWRTARTPYLKEIMDCLSPSSDIEMTVFVKGAQIGGTETLNNFIGYCIDIMPAPILVVQPTVELAKRYSKQRIDSLIEQTPRLASKVKPSRERDSGNTLLAKEFSGGSGLLILTGANSSVGLRSLPARFLGMDEIDSYPQDVDGEGDPVMLAMARTRTYSRRKIYVLSTPTIEGRSKIQDFYDQSDKRRYYIPCPECGHYQTLKWPNIKWDDELKEVWLECESESKCKIEEHFKTQFLADGEWRSENPDARSKKMAGFHLSSLYSPLGWFSWRDAVELWLDSHKDPDRLKAFVNTVLGETWHERGDAPDWRRLYERREDYERGVPPLGCLFLTAGVDVQKDRLEIQIMAWMRNKESYSVDYRVIPGDTADLGQSGPWAALSEMIMDESLPIRLTGIDSGYEAHTVYEFVRRFPPNKVIAVKGFDRLQSHVGTPSVQDVNLSSGRKLRRGLRLWPIGASLIKTEIYANLRLDRPTAAELEKFGYPPGFIHLPTYDEDYFKQLTAEQIISRVVKGFRKHEWVKIYDRNEALDTLVMARACASIVGLDRMSRENPAQAEAIETYRPDDKAKESPESGENLQKFREISENRSENPRIAPIIERKKSSFWR